MVGPPPSESLHRDGGSPLVGSRPLNALAHFAWASGPSTVTVTKGATLSVVQSSSIADIEHEVGLVVAVA